VTALTGRRLGAALRWLAILGVFLATAEAFARLDDTVTWGAPLLRPYTHDRLLLQDSLGFRGRPGYRYQKWRMNNEGFRGPDLAPAPTPGRIRVAVVGASETFGLYESEGAEYPARMQVLLDSLAPGRFEVINAGLPGMSLSSMISYFGRAVRPVQPQMVLIYLAPAFYLEIKPLAAVYAPPRFTSPAARHIGPWAFPPDFFESRLGGKARDVLKELIPTFAVTAVREWRLNRQRSTHETGWVWRSVPEDRMAIFGQHLERLVTSIQATGVKVALVTHTNRFIGAPSDTLGPDRRHLVNVMSLYWPQASPGVLLAVDSVANAITRQVAVEHGAAVLEVEGRIPPSPKYFADYVHFTDAGADSMARIIAAGVIRLAGDSLFPPTPKPAGQR